MKIFRTFTQLPGEAPCPLPRPVAVPLPDTVLLPPKRPFFVPDHTRDCVATLCLAFRINRLGRSIARRFASRYYASAEVAPAVHFVARDLLARWQAAEDKESEYAAICEELGQEIGSAVTLAAVEGDPLSSAIEALEVGGMDAIIDPYEDGTCYVVMRTETDMSAVAQTYFDVLWEQRLESAVVVTNSKLYDAIDAGTFYQALAQLRADMAAENGDTAA